MKTNTNCLISSDTLPVHEDRQVNLHRIFNTGSRPAVEIKWTSSLISEDALGLKVIGTLMYRPYITDGTSKVSLNHNDLIFLTYECGWGEESLAAFFDECLKAVEEATEKVNKLFA